MIERKSNGLTAEQHEIAKDIMTMLLRQAARECSYLDRSIFLLELRESENISSLGADYEYLYYNPSFIIEKYKGGKNKLYTAVIHCVLHCLLLHPSFISKNQRLFDMAADFAVLVLMANGELLNGNAEVQVRALEKEFPSCSTADIVRAVQGSSKLMNRLKAVTSSLKMDDHDVWYTSKKRDEVTGEQGDADESVGQIGVRKISKAEKAARAAALKDEIKKAEAEWGEQFNEYTRAGRNGGYGSAHGNMFASSDKPSRFSRFSYKEYLKRFLRREVIEEDPETLDMIMYTAGLDIYGDVPIVEFSETKEFGSPSDIMIAIDMSGSCGGETANNFLRQVYTIFEQMEIRGKVRIHVVTFDTRIISDTVINSANDAKNYIDSYQMSGFGGTDFNCVFDRADKLGKRLKGLLFFSDGCGSFPFEKPSYKTVFFIPSDGFTDHDYYENFMPDWAEAVKYKD